MDASQTAHENPMPESDQHPDNAPDEKPAKPSLGELVDKALRYLRIGQGELGNVFSETVRRNPLPAALLGAGLGWLAIVLPWGRRGKSTDQESGDSDVAMPQSANGMRVFFNQPLVLGAMGVALGAVLAATLRETAPADAVQQGEKDEVAPTPEAEQPPLAEVTRRAG